MLLNTLIITVFLSLSRNKEMLLLGRVQILYENLFDIFATDMSNKLLKIRKINTPILRSGKQ
jgi:hypothetical protein